MKQQNNFLKRLSGGGILILTSCIFLLFGSMQKAIAQPQFYNTNVAGTGNAFPLNSATNKVQWIYGPGLFNSAGTTGTPAYNGNITTVYLKISTTVSATAVYSNFTVKLSQNLGTQNTWAPATGTIPFHTGMTTCFFAASHSLTGVVASSWYPIVLQTPFTYDPALSLQIEVSVSAGTGNTVAQVATTGLMQRLYAASTATSGTANTALMMLGMDLVPNSPCVDPPTPGTATTTSASVCTGQSASLNLSGNSTGSGQEYLWFSSATSGGPYAPLGLSSFSSSKTINPSSSAYYICEVKCGGTTLPSTEVFVNVPPLFPGGYYTIDNTLSTGGGNFASFNDAIAAIACGISGPVIFDVASGTGPYNEQVTIPQVGGTSLTNTVTFLGNGNTLSYNATLATAPHTLALNGSDFFRFNDLNIVGTGPTYALVGHLWNNANDNIFTNCTFTSPVNGIATTHVPFSCSGSETVATTAGASGSNNELINCTMTSGYYGINFVGNSASPNTGNKVMNCTIKDQYLYSSYNLYQNGLIISGNIIERPARSTFTTSYNGIYLGTGCSNVLVEKNRIRNTWVLLPTSTATQYSIYDLSAATLGNENKIYNNLISDINFNGVLYGIYVTSNHKKVYHNTISFDHTGATGTTTTYGIYVSGATGVDVQNNNVSITRGGAGAKYCVYYTVLSIISNYNNLYVNSAAGTNCVGFYLAGFPDLTAWKAGNGSIWDQQSVSGDPAYANPAIGNYQPTNVVLDNIGGNLGITTDITGATRTTTPDPGCYEFTVSLLDVGALTFSAPGTSGCYTTTENISVTIKNYGAATLDFAIDPVTVICDVSGALTTTLTANPVGTLAPGATMLVTFSPPIDMTINGIYSFSPYTTLAGDGNVTNDALNSPVVRTVGPIGGTVTATIPQICVSGTTTLNAAGVYGGSLQWQESSSASGPWTNVGTGTNSYTPPSVLTQTTYYQVEVSCNGNLGYSNVAVVTVNNPQILSTTPASRCGPGTVNLDATVNSGLSVKWYNNPTGGAPLFTGTPFTTPTIATTTTFYAEALAGIGGADSLAVPLANGTTSGVNFHMFLVSSPTGMTLNGMGIKANQAIGILTSWDIYYRPDNYQLVPGSNISSTGWILFSSVTGIPSLGATDYTMISFGQNLSIPPGATYSFHIAPVGGATHQYGTTAAGTVVSTNSNATIIAGHRGGTTPFNCATAAGIAIVKLKYSLGCVGAPRVPVIATVNAAPTITVSTADPVLCPGLSTTVSVNSPNDPDYTYTWTSSIGGFTATGAGPHTVSPLATTTYTVNAIDNTAGPFAGCANSASVTVVTAPAVLPGTVSSNLTTICVSGSPVLSVSGSAAGNIQWQESATSATGPWMNVGAGSTTYAPGTISQTTHYRVEVSCGTTIVQSNVVTVTVNNPAITSTTPGIRCGYGTVLLDATPEPGAVVKWYDAMVAGNQVGVGNSLTTPPIASTTTFYAEASTGSGSGAASPLLITEVDLGGPDQLEIQNVSPDPLSLAGWKVAVSDNYSNINAVNVIIQNLTGTLNSGGTLTWSDVAGPNYWGNNLFWNPGPPSTTSFTGWAAILDNNNVLRDFVVWNWPSANIAGAIVTVGTTTITVGTQWSGNGIDATLAVTPLTLTRQGTTDNNSSSDFVIVTSTIGSTNSVMTIPFLGFGCQGTRVPVIATVTPSPSISASATATVICQNTSTTLSVSSPNDPDYTYTWNPGNLSGSSVNVSPITTTIYTVTAIDNTAGPNAGCGNVATVTIVMNPILVSTTPTASPSALCDGGNVNLSANALSPGYTMNGACTTGFIDISTTGTDIDLPANIIDDSEHNIAIPSFTFDGITYTNARIGTNGVIALGSIAGEIAPGNGPIPNGVTHTAGNILLAPFSDDLYPTVGTSSSIKTQSIGSTFIIQWTNLSHFDDSLVGTVTFQVQLDATSGVVTFVYNDVIFGNQIMDEGASATVGIQLSATNGIQYSLNTASLSNGQCINFTPNTVTVSWAGPNSFNSTLSNPTLSSVTSADGGTYTVTATGVNGCTTTAIVNVTVNPPTLNTTTATSPCGTPYTWAANSNTYTLSGIYTHTSLNVNGCLHTETLDLTIAPCNTTLNLNLVIEGYWDGAGSMLPVLMNQGEPFTATQCDHITVELHELANPATISYTTNAILNTNGTVSAVFTSAVTGSYYIVIKHRNALQTWSANAESFPATTSYSFSSAATQAYGSNQVEVATGVWALYSGDCAIDENMDLLDLALVETDLAEFVFGYNYDVSNTNYPGVIGTDLNGDGNTDLLDSPTLESNISNFIFSLHP